MPNANADGLASSNIRKKISCCAESQALPNSTNLQKQTNRISINLYVNSMWQLSFDVQTKTIANALELESDVSMTKFRDSKYLTKFTFKDEANLNF